MNVRVRTALKIIFTIIYAISVIHLVVFGVIYLQHSMIVPYPDAMLPMKKYEIAAWRLIIGFPFMVASGISIVIVYKIRKAKKIIIAGLPAVVSLVMCISYFLI